MPKDYLENQEDDYEEENETSCGSACGCDDNIEFEKIKLVLEDGREVTASVLEMLRLEDKEYMALLPDGEDNVLLYEFREHEDAIELVNIESDEEFEAVSQVFFDLVGYEDIESDK